MSTTIDVMVVKGTKAKERVEIPARLQHVDKEKPDDHEVESSAVTGGVRRSAEDRSLTQGGW